RREQRVFRRREQFRRLHRRLPRGAAPPGVARRDVVPRSEGRAFAGAEGGNRPRLRRLSRDERRRLRAEKSGPMAGLDQNLYRKAGHLTVPGVFAAREMDAVVEDIGRWGEEFLAALAPDQRRWYVDGGVKARAVLRKREHALLDTPY